MGALPAAKGAGGEETGREMPGKTESAGTANRGATEIARVRIPKLSALGGAVRLKTIAVRAAKRRRAQWN
jgi:hypothetical protein